MKRIRRHLGWKLFLSYLTIVIIGVVSLAIAAELHAPLALTRHVSNMEALMDSEANDMVADLLENFQTAVTEVLLVAAAIAVVSAIIVSTFVTRRIVQPIQEMQIASQRIASGRYEERVQVVGEDELAELARSFNQMAHTLSQTEERRRQLIGDVAHELRTPLSSIKGVMEGLQDGVLPAEPATFASIEHEISRLQRLVGDLEELSRAEAGQIPLQLEDVDTAVFIQAAAERLQLQYEDKGVSLTLELGDDLPPVQVDTARMTQVILNLLGNALQYTPAGESVTVHSSVASNQLADVQGEQCVQIRVADTGIGISPEQVRHLFERFYRVDKSRARTGGGSGIGLTISKHLVEMHGGSLTASSPGINQGATFTVTLPIGVGE